MIHRLKRVSWAVLCAAQLLSVSAEAKTYGSGAKTFSSPKPSYRPSPSSPRPAPSTPRPSAFQFKSAPPSENPNAKAARALQQEASKKSYDEYKARTTAPQPQQRSDPAPAYNSPSPQPRYYSSDRSYSPPTQVVRREVVYVERDRSGNIAPWVLALAISSPAWAYHHRSEIPPAQYERLLRENGALRNQVDQMERDGVAVDPKFAATADVPVEPVPMVPQATVARPEPQRAASSFFRWVGWFTVISGAAAGAVYLIFFKQWKKL